jgi:CRISPR-associated protein Cas2
MADERLYIVAYDIGDRKRWRRVFKTMNGYGQRLQLSVFQCRLSRRRRAELETRLRGLIRNGEDHVLLIDVGPAEGVDVSVESLGRTYEAIERLAVLV